MSNHIVHITKEFSLPELNKGVFLVVTEASRIPPHIGLMVDGKFSSLTVKGKEIEIAAGVLVKNIMIRKIPSIFFQIKKHPVFSAGYLNELLISCVSEYHRVEAEGPTCLTPVKNFFREGYQLNTCEIDFLFHLIPQLEENQLVENAGGFNLPRESGTAFSLPVYSCDEINERIQKVRLEYNV